MALLLNQEDMERMLKPMLKEGDSYKAMTWTTIMAGNLEVLALGALSNVSAYVGITDKELVLAVLGTMNIDKVNAEVHVPFEDIESLKIKKSLIPGQKSLEIKAKEGKLRLSLINNPLTAKIDNQKEAINTICSILESNVKQFLVFS